MLVNWLIPVVYSDIDITSLTFYSITLGHLQALFTFLFIAAL